MLPCGVGRSTTLNGRQICTRAQYGSRGNAETNAVRIAFVLGHKVCEVMRARLDGFEGVQLQRLGALQGTTKLDSCHTRMAQNGGMLFEHRVRAIHVIAYFARLKD